MYVVGMHINACVSGQHIGCMCIVNTCRAPVRFYRSAVCAPSVVQPLTRHIVPEKGGSESTASHPLRLILPSVPQPLQHLLSEQSSMVKRAVEYSGGRVRR